MGILCFSIGSKKDICFAMMNVSFTGRKKLCKEKDICISDGLSDSTGRGL